MPTYREREDDGRNPGEDPINTQVWIDVNWSFTEPPPTGLATGFEVVAYTGSDPNDTNKYLRRIQEVNIADRRCVYSLFALRGVPINTINAAVRTVYPWAKSAWASSAASTTATPRDPIFMNNDSLFPNGTSEQGADATGYGAILLVSDAGNAYAGSWVRKLNAAATNETAMTPPISCLFGDQFTYQCYVKATNGTAQGQLVLKFLDASLAVVGTSTSAASGGTTYLPLRIRGAVPAGAVYVQAFVKTSTTSASQFMFFDNLSLRRAVSYEQLNGDEGFRLGGGMGNTGVTAADRMYYRGNNDPGTLGGAPAIATLTCTPQVWDTTNKIVLTDLKCQPTAASDNLDGMRYAKVVLYRQSAAGTTGTLTALKTYYVTMADRLFNNVTDSNAANAVFGQLHGPDAGITSGFPAMIVTLYNALGPSVANCFYSGAGWTAGTALVNNGTAFPAGLTGGGSGGGGGGAGGGGSCPAPWEMIDLPGGQQKRADQLAVGDKVWTVHASTGTVGQWPVSHVTPDINERWDMFIDGRALPYTFAKNHPIRTERGWTYIQDLEPGDVLVGDNPKTVASVALRDTGDVIKITVEGAHTYQTDGILSSNLKP